MRSTFAFLESRDLRQFPNSAYIVHVVFGPISTSCTLQRFYLVKAMSSVGYC
jgi:hypothetical protein